MRNNIRKQAIALKSMSPEEYRAFLLAGTRTGKLATTRRNGRPHITPIWFTLDGDDIIFTTWHESIKGRTLRRDPRAALLVDDEHPPFAYVLVEGTVTLSEDLRDLRHWAARIAARYMGEDQAGSYGERNGVVGELLVRLTPEKVIAETRIAE
jgi:PPOX class probable F420-dependent enzyme